MQNKAGKKERKKERKSAIKRKEIKEETEKYKKKRFRVRLLGLMADQRLWVMEW